jgi:hypothetical protein
MLLERLDDKGLDAWWKASQKADAKHWNRVSAEANDYINELAGRDDLAVKIAPGAGRGALAVFLPEEAEVEVDADKCAAGIDPADIDLATEAGRLQHPALSGAGAHEGGHGWASTWPLDQSPEKRAVVQAALLLEESRMEKHLLERRPDARVLLRASLTELVATHADASTPMGAASVLALIVARADAGVMDAAEVAPAWEAAAATLGEDRAEALRSIWREAHALPRETTAEAMEALGRKWLDVLGEDAQYGDEGHGIACGHRDDGDNEGEGDGDGSGIAEAIAEAVAADAEAEARDGRAAAEARDEAKAADKEAQQERKDAEKAHLMEKDAVIAHGSGWGYEGLSGEREPTGAEYAQANILAQRLRSAQYRDRTTTMVASELPPGRLRSAQAVQRAAQRAQGIPPTAAPFRRVQHKVVEQPPITVGVGCDISGSMRSLVGPVASAAWIIAHAVQQVDGTTATAAFGESVHPVVRPGEVPRKVREFNASGGMENIVDFLQAASGSLHLMDGRGLRLVVVVSDGHWTHDQRHRGDRLARRLTDAGVRILHVGWRHTDIPLAGSTFLQLGNPDTFGEALGQAMVDLLEAA